jgi:hypothetical protein
MSKWTHAICVECWDKQQPGREPVTVLNGTEQTCCFCGQPTKAGIYIREDPKGMRCEGQHDDE